MASATGKLNTGIGELDVIHAEGPLVSEEGPGLTVLEAKTPYILRGQPGSAIVSSAGIESLTLEASADEETYGFDEADLRRKLVNKHGAGLVEELSSCLTIRAVEGLLEDKSESLVPLGSDDDAEPEYLGWIFPLGDGAEETGRTSGESAVVQYTGNGIPFISEQVIYENRNHVRSFDVEADSICDCCLTKPCTTTCSETECMNHLMLGRGRMSRAVNVNLAFEGQRPVLARYMKFRRKLYAKLPAVVRILKTRRKICWQELAEISGLTVPNVMKLVTAHEDFKHVLNSEGTCFLHGKYTGRVKVESAVIEDVAEVFDISRSTTWTGQFLGCTYILGVTLHVQKGRQGPLVSTLTARKIGRSSDASRPEPGIDPRTSSRGQGKTMER